MADFPTKVNTVSTYDQAHHSKASKHATVLHLGQSLGGSGGTIER